MCDESGTFPASQFTFLLLLLLFCLCLMFTRVCVCFICWDSGDRHLPDLEPRDRHAWGSELPTTYRVDFNLTF